MCYGGWLTVRHQHLALTPTCTLLRVECLLGKVIPVFPAPGIHRRRKEADAQSLCCALVPPAPLCWPSNAGDVVEVLWPVPSPGAVPKRRRGMSEGEMEGGSWSRPWD